MDPLKLFKFPIVFAGSLLFQSEIKKLNITTTDDINNTDLNIKYILCYKYKDPT
jgi:hypothetical protein